MAPDRSVRIEFDNSGNGEPGAVAPDAPESRPSKYRNRNDGTTGYVRTCPNAGSSAGKRRTSDWWMPWLLWKRCRSRRYNMGKI